MNFQYGLPSEALDRIKAIEFVGSLYRDNATFIAIEEFIRRNDVTPVQRREAAMVMACNGMGLDKTEVAADILAEYPD